MLGIGRRVNFKFTLRGRFSSRTQFCHYDLAVCFARLKSDAFGAPFAPFFRILPPRFLLA
jgi:hypothetical protein